MTPEAQQKAIEEACGVRGCTPKADMDRMLASLSAEERINAFAHKPSKDYLKDLNAMHEAEDTLTWHQQRYYAQVALPKLTEGKLVGGQVFATAPQRAEAFLRTIKKWVEE